MNQQTDNSGLTVSAGAVALVALVALAAVGAGNATGATAETGLTVETSWADALGESEEIVAANVTSLGVTGNATVWIEYREQNTSTWQESGNLTVSQTGEIRFEITGLERGTTYEYRGVAAELDGNESDVGQVRTFTTVTTSPSVTIDPPATVDESSATLNATLEGMGGADTVDVSFEYRQAGSDFWQGTASETLSAPGSVTRTVTGLASDTSYEYRAVAVASDGDEATGAIRTVTTDAVEHAPSVDVLAAAEDSPPNPHAEVSVDWAVSDADGDLSRVSVTVTDSWGGTVASETEAVTGASASGSFYSKIKHGAGETYTVTVTVTDAGGRTTTASTTVGA